MNIAGVTRVRVAVIIVTAAGLPLAAVVARAAVHIVIVAGVPLAPAHCRINATTEVPLAVAHHVKSRKRLAVAAGMPLAPAYFHANAATGAPLAAAHLVVHWKRLVFAAGVPFALAHCNIEAVRLNKLVQPLTGPYLEETRRRSKSALTAARTYGSRDDQSYDFKRCSRTIHTSLSGFHSGDQAGRNRISTEYSPIATPQKRYSLFPYVLLCYQEQEPLLALAISVQLLLQSPMKIDWCPLLNQ